MKLLSHLVGYLPVNIASGVASFGGVYVYTRLLGAEEYGIYALMISALALIHTISLTWVEAANYRFTGKAQAEDDLPGHFQTATKLMLRSIMVALLLAVLLWIAVRDLPRYAAIMPWIAVLLPIDTVIKMALEAHRAGQRVGRYAFVETFRLLAGFVLGALLCLWLRWGAAAPFMGLTIAGGLMVLREGPWLFSAAKGGTAKPETQKAWLWYGLPIAAALVLDILLSAGDRFLIAYILGEAAVGAYAAGYGVADKTVLLICAWAAMAGSPLVMAAYERHGPTGAKENARMLARTLLMVGAPAAAGIALVAPPLAEAMIGEAVREEALQIMPWIAVAGLLNGFLIYYFSEAFQLAHKTLERAFLMLIPVIANLAANIVLLPIYGLMGAVWATVACYALGIVILAIAGRRHFAMPIPLRDIILTSIACVAMWPATLLVPNEWAAWPELFAKAFAGGGTYVIVAMILDAGGARQFVRDKLKASKSTKAT
jgi:O-antigen/teichoic acid export membrane protein